MINVIFGDKGSGKTKEITQMANEAAAKDYGDVVFIDKNNRYTLALDRKIRYVDVNDYELRDLRELYGFLSGVIAQNYDIDKIYIDGILDMYIQEEGSVEKFFANLQRLSKDFNVKFYITISGNPNMAPKFLKEYAL